MEPSSGAGTGWAWRIAPIAGLLIWVGVMVVAAVTLASPSDPSPVVASFVGGGAVYFSLLFAGAAVSMRRAQRRTRDALFDRLVVVPPERGEIARATRPMFTIGYVYIAFGATVTACGLTIAAIGTDAGRPIVWALMVLLGAWVLFAFYALGRSMRTTTMVVRPLGLALTEFPSVNLVPFGDGARATMAGAVSYAGVRHGRRVSITQTANAAATAVSGHLGTQHTPSSATEMAAITGEPSTCWRQVTVRTDGDTVLVTRRGNGAGAWFLHDLLLAEAVAR